MAKLAKLAKFSPPHQIASIPRTRLFQQLDTLSAQSAAWIAASPGAGKTTLIASYIEERNYPACWYRLDDGDRDLVVFFDHFSQAIQTAFPLRQPFLKFRPEHITQIDTFARRYFRDILNKIKTPCALVIDNIHDAIDQNIGDILRILIEEASDQITLFFISRTDPPASFVTLKVQHKLKQLDPEALCFTQEETALLFADHDAKMVSTIQQFTKGWAAGMVLMAIQYRNTVTADPMELRNASKDAIFNFFAAEILRRMPEKKQRFLYLTALLPDISVAHARALTKNPQSAAMLDGFYRQHLFISSRRGPPISYQYHDLFRTFLLKQAELHLSPAELKAARLQAAKLLLVKDNVPAALELLRQAQEWQLLRGMLIDAAPKLLRHGRYMTLRHEIELLRNQHRGHDEEDAWISYWMGLACIREDEMTGLDWLERAYTEFSRLDSALGKALCAASAINTLHASWEAHLGFTTWTMRLRETTFEIHQPLAPEQDLEISCAIVSSAFFGESTTYSELTIENRIEHIIGLIDRENKKLDVNAIGIAGRIMLEHYILQGDEAMSSRIRALIEPLIHSSTVSPLIRGLWVIYSACFRAYVDYLNNKTKNRLTDYAEWNEGCAIAKREQLALLGFVIAYSEVQVAMVRDERKNFPMLIDALRERVDFSKPAPAAAYYGAKCWMHLWRNEIPEALLAGEQMSSCVKNIQLTSADRMWLCLRYSYALLADQREDEAIRCIESTALNSLHHRYRVAQGIIQLIKAIQNRRLGKDYVPQLQEGLTCMAQYKFPIFFNVLPEYASQICCDALKHDIQSDFVRQCIVRRELKPPQGASECWPWPIKIRLLGNFDVMEHDKSIRWGQKTPRKQLELLKAIAVHNRSGLSKQQLLDWFWQDTDSEESSFRVTLHRLRKLFKNEQAILLEDQRVYLHPDYIWIDITNFEALCARLLKMNLMQCSETVLKLEANTLLSVYCGPLLADMPASNWITPARDRLNNQFRQVVQALGSALEARQAWRLALDLYTSGVATDPLTEEFYAGQIRCHIALGEPSAAMNAFRHCRELLSVVLGLKPSPKIHALISHIILDSSVE